MTRYSFFRLFSLVCVLCCVPVLAATDGMTPLITSASQLSSNASDAQEGQHIEYLIDGDASTFWHSDWHNGYDSSNPHYVQVRLNSNYSGNLMLYLRRRGTSNDHPTQMMITGSADNKTWTQIATLDLPYEGAGTEVYSDIFQVKTAVRYLRATATNCTGDDNYGFRGFWHSAELQFYSVDAESALCLRLETIVNRYADYLNGKTFDIGSNTGQYRDSESAAQFMEALQRACNILSGKETMPSESEVQALVDLINNSYNAVIASEVLFQFQDGYYRVITNMKYYVTNSSGEREYITKAMYCSQDGVGWWGTLDQHNLSYVWRLTQKSGGIEMLNVGTGMQFQNLSAPVTLSTTSTNLMAFDHVGNENGHAILYIRLASSEKNYSSNIYLHQWYHSLGTGTGHEMCVWMGTYNLTSDKGTSEWYIEPLNDEEIAAINGTTDQVKLSDSQLQMEMGESYTLTYTLTPANNFFNKLSWWSSNTSVATVDQDGNVTAEGVGTAIIYAKANDAKGASASCTITVTRTPATAESLVINEIQSANIDQFMDPSWNYGGWVELYNSTDHAVNISGFYISDDPDDLKKNLIDKGVGVIPTHGFLNLWFDHYDAYCVTQIDDKLDVDGGTIYISNEKGELIASQSYPQAVSRCSYARLTDGGTEWGMTSTPTPSASNVGSSFADARLSAPEVDQDSQLFTGSLKVKVAIPDGATLRYTTDGSTPTLQNGSTSLSGTFNVTQTKVYRFCLFQDGYLPSQVITRSYIYKDKEFDIPVVSIATKSDNVWSTEYGVFAKGENGRSGNGQSDKCNWNMDWDRPVNVEFFDSEGNLLINQEATFAASGGWSRAWEPHSIELKASKMYELEGTFEASLLPTKPYNKYKVFKLRNGGNDYTCRLKDAAIQEIIRTSDFYVDTQGYYPVCHFINGVYMGTLNFREPNNKNYGYSNYGYDTDEEDQFEVSPDYEFGIMAGTRDAFDKIRELAQNSADPVAYEQLKDLLDIDEYINYMAVEFYIGASDWVSNNVKGFRSRDPEKDGRYHIVLFDTDDALATINPFTRYDGFNGTFAMVFKWLLQNPDFVKQFVDTYCMVIGSVYEPTRVKEVVNAMASRVEKMQGYSNYYNSGTSPWSTANTVISTFESTSRRDFMLNALQNYTAFGLADKAAQHVTLSSSVQNAKILLNGMNVPTGKFDGTLFAPVKLEAKAPMGYTFRGWGRVETQTSTLSDEGSEWKYYDQGSLDGADWKSVDYQDDAWSAGKAPLGYGRASSGYNTTLEYGGNSSNKYVSYYFRRKFTLDKALAKDDQITLSYKVDDGCVLYVNGQEALRYQMPTGDVGFSTLATTYAGTDPNTGTVLLDASLFRAGENVIAVEVHNSSVSSSDIYWDCSIGCISQGYSSTFVSTDPVYTLPSTGDHTLVAIYDETSQEELMAKGATPIKVNEISGANDRYMNDRMKKTDWIELYNTTSQDVDIAGMFITDDLENPHKYQIPTSDTINTVIPAFGFLTLWADKKDAVSQIHTGFELDKDGGSVRLTSSDDRWYDILTYPAHTSVQTVGLYPDGGSSVYVMTKPTISAQNLIGSYSVLYGEKDIDNAVRQPSIESDLAQNNRIVRVEYYSLDGERLQKPQHGVTIIRQICANGQVLSRKLLLK